MVRAGLRSLLDADPEISVVGEAADGIAAIDEVRRREPDGSRPTSATSSPSCGCATASTR
jgi:hypothetical protein